MNEQSCDLTHRGVVSIHEATLTLRPWAGPRGGARTTTVLLLVAVGAKVMGTAGTDVIRATTQVTDLMTLRVGEGGGE